MRSISLALTVSLLFFSPVSGSERHVTDAALHAVQFVDLNEGWAVGDEGVIWHTIDGGKTWERQPTGLRASLRSLHFLDPFTGYVAGREGLPHSTGSAGVILGTQDGGVTWQRLSVKTLPGLNHVRFMDKRTGLAVGQPSDQHPGGIFVTQDSGVTWKPIPAKSGPGWLAADYLDGENGVLVGPWGNLVQMRSRQVSPAEIDSLRGRTLRAAQFAGQAVWAVGDGGLVLLSDTAGKRWGPVDLRIPTSLQNCWDFHGLHFAGESGWVVGRPGSVVLHTWDGGTNWQVQQTGQPLPLHGVFFMDEKHGWAVGELGTILATCDGGKTWKVQQRGGHRAAVLFITAQSQSVPAGSVALLGADEGYLTAALKVVSADPGSAAPGHASDETRLAEATRRAGGCAGEALWQFPLPEHLARIDATQLGRHWGNSQDEARGLEELERQLVLALRIWRPSVVITDNPDPRSPSGHPGAVVALAMSKAFRRAGQADVYPEQLAKLDLQPWEPSKLYSRWETADGSHVTQDLREARPRLLASALDYSAAARSLLLDSPEMPAGQVYYRLLDSRIENADRHPDLMQGTQLQWGGQARREFIKIDEEGLEKAVKAARQVRDVQGIIAEQMKDPAKANQVVATLEKSLDGLSEDQAGEAAFICGNLYARAGQWPMAKEVFLLMVDRYPTHRLAPDACRWLIQYGSSSEARRREELGQFQVSGHVIPIWGKPGSQAIVPDSKKTGFLRQMAKREGQEFQEEIAAWYKSAVALADCLQAFGMLHADDPRTQFAVQSAKKALGNFDGARLFYTQYRLNHDSGPWYDAAGAELWLASRSTQPPKPILQCVQAAKPPYLDGKLDDACWKDADAVKLKDAIGKTVTEYPTEVWLTHDGRYLYLALRCRHPEAHMVPPVKPRPRDADLRPFDRVSLLLDLDRDYSTYFHFQVDQRGCVCEDCWGDRSWNPKWSVAVHSDATGWQIEAAIPWVELTATPPTPGQAWACNLVRSIPGKGVQAFSTPADVNPRPEGMGLLLISPPIGDR